MRILFFSPQQLWPVNSGSRLRNVHLAGALANRFPVTLLQVLQPHDREEKPADCPPFEAILSARKRRSYSLGTILKGMIGPNPVTVLNYISSDVGRCLSSVLNERRFDAVQLESSNLFSYLDIIRSAPNRPALVIDWHNIDSELMARYASEAKGFGKRLVAHRTARLLSHLESKLMEISDTHIVVSERDKARLQQLNPRARINVVPNGVDAAAFNPSERTGTQQALLFVGSMDYHANIDAVTWFVQNVWPGISSRFPALTFTIVGRSPGSEVQALASEKIMVTGTVDDVRPFYADAAAVIVPVRVGGGTRLKILEAMAMGVPVVSTTLGAEGISATNGNDILFADSPEQFLNCIEAILGDPSLHRRLSNGGRNLVCQHYDWAAISDRLYCVYSDLIAARSEV